jgi:hypothetical protein
MIRAQQLERALRDLDPKPAKYEVKYLLNKRPKFKQFATLDEATDFAAEAFGRSSLVFVTKLEDRKAG